MGVAPSAERNLSFEACGTPITSFLSQRRVEPWPLKCKLHALHATYAKEFMMGFKSFVPAIGRPQIQAAVEEIIDRHNSGQVTTSIVLPPRVGKSNVIRLAAMELMQTRRACAALALAPWDNLADQLVDESKVSDMLTRYKPTPMPYGIDQYRGGRVSKLSPTFHEVRNTQHLWTATVQMVNMQLPIFRAWLERCMSYSHYGSRPIVFIDEGHLLSGANRWGNIAAAVQEYGAHVVLLTGTPYRADNETIPGFSIETVVEAEDVSLSVVVKNGDGAKERRRYEGTVSRRKLIPDFEMTLKEAWALPALCKVEAHWIDPVLKIEGEEVALSNLNVTASTKHLRMAVQHEKTIRMAVERAVQDMRDRRAAGMKDAGIIFVTTSDLDIDGIEISKGGSSDWHARRVRDALRDIAPDLHVLIATQAEENEKGARNLQKFSEHGIGDVLIVKNMGTVGMDCARIKTVVLLNTTRQLATWVQTILRGATMSGKISHFSLILTDDAKNRENWDFIVTGQGGEFSAYDLKMVGTEAVDGEEDQDRKDKVVELLSAEVSRTEDSHVSTVVDDDTLVRRAITKTPLLRERFSIPEIMDMIRSGAIVVDGAPEYDGASVGVVNTGKTCLSLRDSIEKLARDCASLVVNYDYDRKGWVSEKTKLSREANDFAGVRGGIPSENDLTKLENVKKWLEERKQILEGVA
jgi:superfamily II DNA or RNA helicase